MIDESSGLKHGHTDQTARLRQLKKKKTASFLQILSSTMRLYSS